MIPIIRKIDDLGRIVIPKDIRKDLRIYKDDYLNMVIASISSFNISIALWVDFSDLVII